jgi:hypothetical protein
MAMRMISPPSLAANDPYAVSASDSLRKWKIRKGKIGLTRDIPRVNSKTAQPGSNIRPFTNMATME